MNDDPRISEIRSRMAALRRSLDGDVKQVADSARAMADWRYYPRRFPWASVAVAAAVGYFVIPKRKQIVSPDAETTNVAERDGLVVKRKAKPHTTPRMVNSLIAMAAAGAMRVGTNYLWHALMASSTSNAESPNPREPRSSRSPQESKSP